MQKANTWYKDINQRNLKCTKLVTSATSSQKMALLILRIYMYLIILFLKIATFIGFNDCFMKMWYLVEKFHEEVR